MFRTRGSYSYECMRDASVCVNERMGSIVDRVRRRRGGWRRAPTRVFRRRTSSRRGGMVDEERVDKTEVYLRYLPRSATEAAIREMLAGCGKITRVWVGLDRETNACKGYAFVNFSKNREARECVMRMNEHPRNYLDGKHVVFEHAKAWDGHEKRRNAEASSSGGGGGGGGKRKGATTGGSDGHASGGSSANANGTREGKIRKKQRSKTRLGAKARQRAKKRAAKEAAAAGGGGE